MIKKLFKDSARATIYFFIILLIAVIVSQIANAEIINERTEKDGNTYSFYTSKHFHNNGQRWFYFNEWVNLSIINRDLIYRTPENIVNISIWITYRDVDRPLSSVNPTMINQVNLRHSIQRERDYYKFNVSFNKPVGLTRIGFKLNSNSDFNFNQIERFISNNFELSLDDIRDMNLPTHLDRNTGIFWVDISSLSGVIHLDPVSTFYSQSNDGYTRHYSTGCGAISTGTTGLLGLKDDGAQLDDYRGYFEFNTSAIADNQTVTSADLSVYSGRVFNNDLCYFVDYNIQYHSKSWIGGTLDCADSENITNSEGALSWGTTTGYKTKSVSTSSINITGHSTYKLSTLWQTCEVGGYFYYQFRTSEFTGTTTDPKLVVTTIDTVTTPADQRIEKVIYPLILILIMIFIASKKINKGRDEKSTV